MISVQLLGLTAKETNKVLPPPYNYGSSFTVSFLQLILIAFLLIYVAFALNRDYTVVRTTSRKVFRIMLLHLKEMSQPSLEQCKSATHCLSIMIYIMASLSF